MTKSDVKQPAAPLPRFELCINSNLFAGLKKADGIVLKEYTRKNAVYFIVVDDRVPEGLVYIYTESGHFERKFRYEA